jgi:hypothetical protein
MTLQRTKATDWVPLDKLTSTQINAIDHNIEGALDKRSGQTDTLGSVVTATSGGRLVYTNTTGPDADTTFTIGSSIYEIVPTALTSARVYTLSNTGAVTGDKITIISSALFDITVKDNSAVTIALLGVLNTQGQILWAEFKYTGTAWILHRYAAARDTSSSKGKMVALCRMPITP